MFPKTGVDTVEPLLPESGLGPGGIWITLGAAGLFGLIPESGPQLLFVTMYHRCIASPARPGDEFHRPVTTERCHSGPTPGSTS